MSAALRATSAVLSGALPIALATALASGVATAELGAQATRPLASALGQPTGGAAAVAARGMPTARDVAARDLRGLTPVVVMPSRPYPTAEPSSLRSMFVSIPAAVVASGGTFYVAEPGPWRSIGPRAGMLIPGDSAPLAYTLMVPAMATAGENMVGLLRFVPTGGRAYYDVPLMVDVASRTQLSLEPTQPVLGARPGERLRTGWVLRNAGNADVEVELTFTAASGWMARPAAGGTIRVPRGSAVTVPVDLALPFEVGGGDFSVVGVARTMTGDAVSTQQGVFVDGVARSGSAGFANVRVASVRDDAAVERQAVAVDFSTGLAAGLQLSGRVGGLSAPATGLGANTLGGLGFTDRMRQLELRGDGWSVMGGNVGARSGGLSGVGLFGDGVVAALERRDWRGDAVALQPVLAEGRYLYGRGQRRVGDGWVGLLVNDLSDGLFVERAARTVALDLSLPTALGAVDLQGGYRQTTFGNGAAFQLDMGNRVGPWSYSLAAGHAPGGAAAFANAENTWLLDGARELGPRAAVTASVWGNDDGARSDRRFSSLGWSTGARWAPRPMLQLEADLRHSAWENRSSLGDVANGETALSMAASWLRGMWQLRGHARAGSVRREADLLGLGGVTTTAGQLSTGLQASRSFSTATVSASTSVERTGGGVGLPAQQTSFELRAERIPLLAPRVFAYAEYGVFVLGSTGARLDAQSLGLDIELPLALALRLEANRNALFRRAGGDATPWTFAVRMERALVLPSATGRRVLGRVFLDENANGRFDRGDRALPGVVVEVGGVPTSTDRDGKFRGMDGAEAQLDVRSLPPGYLVAPGSVSASGDIAVVSTAPVEIALRVENPERVPLGPLDLRRAIVRLRDERGRVWSDVASAEGSVRFDALPLGRYRVEVETADVGEAIVPLSTLPTVEVTDDRRGTRLAIVLGPRPMRIQPLPSGRRIQLDGAGQREERR